MSERVVLALDQAALVVHAERAAGRARRVVLTNGCFDLLHVGHVRMLEDARAAGDFLVVALNDDDSVARLKGPGRPRQPLAERAELVAALRAVDLVTSFGEPTVEFALRSLRPDVHAKGTDYTAANLPERDVDDELGIEMVFVGDPKRHHSSELGGRLGEESF